MKLCGEDCVVSCCYCKYRKTEYIEHMGDVVFGCLKHEDEKHQHEAMSFGSCEDFHCEDYDEQRDAKVKTQ